MNIKDFLCKDTYLNCITNKSLSKFHKFIEYKTLFKHRTKYVCLRCNLKLNIDQYQVYKKEEKAWWDEVRLRAKALAGIL